MARNNKKYKTYPFPFLADYSTDYKKTKFNLEVNYKPEKDKITFQINYSINNDELVESLKDGILRVAAKIVCSTMGFSRVVPIKKGYNSTTVSYDSMQFDNDVEITAYLIAETDFTLENPDLSDSWINERPVVQANNVIGESNERIITINHLKSGSSKSIFQFTQVLGAEDWAPYSISLANSEAIVFKLPTKIFKMFNSLRVKDGGKQFIHMTFIIPTIADILRQMINTEVDEDGDIVENDFNTKHKSKKWYMVLFDNYQNAFDGKDPTVDGGIPPLEAAQTIIDRYAVNNVLSMAKRFTKEL